MHCYGASEAIYHLMGGKEAGLTPMQIEHEGTSHWYLRWETKIGTLYIDPTASQFKTPVPYEKGRGRGFLTKKASNKSRVVFTRV